MSADRGLKVILFWHMHQPEYRDLLSGVYHQPWTYLHAIKDYTDMAAHLEAVPGARAVVNFAPTLLEQITDYAAQLQGFLKDSVAIRDPLLGALASPALPAEPEARLLLIHACLRANETRLIQRFPAYRRLAELVPWFTGHPDALAYVSDQYLADLLVWYHIAWLGETVRRADARVQRLITKASSFNLHDRRDLLTVMSELLDGIIPRYRHLAERGQIELSVTPFAHPIMPLLIDFHAARDAMPQVILPPESQYPGGEERVRWHIRQGKETFRKHFGFDPAGCWPAEGGVSAATLRILAQEGLRWAASGEGVLAHSLLHAGQSTQTPKETWLYAPYTPPDADGLRCFFRDDGLSDLIGFTYATWHADDAVADLVSHLETIARRCREQDDCVVSIILDGENAWEHYPENGYYFLSALYRRLAAHPDIALTTCSDYLNAHPGKPLPAVTAGSWVYGTFSTWIGSHDKNRGWEMLVGAKRAFDARHEQLSAEQREAAERQLAICEGSDWFWWFGDENPAATVSDFDQMFRMHLGNLYQLLGLEPPNYLAHAFTHGGGKPMHGGTMRPAKAG